MLGFFSLTNLRAITDSGNEEIRHFFILIHMGDFQAPILAAAGIGAVAAYMMMKPATVVDL
jgi:hypothetical protein